MRQRHECWEKIYIRARARTIRGAMPLLTYHSIFGNVAPFVFNHLRKFLSSWLEIPDVPSPELLLSWWLISLFLNKIQIFVSFLLFWFLFDFIIVHRVKLQTLRNPSPSLVVQRRKNHTHINYSIYINLKYKLNLYPFFSILVVKHQHTRTHTPTMQQVSLHTFQQHKLNAF